MKVIKYTLIFVLFLAPFFISHAATINTGSLCSFANAIKSAQTDSPISGCVSGSGADTILVNQDESVNTIPPGDFPDGTSAFPIITTDLTINGNNHTITFTNNSTAGRLFNIFGGITTIKNLNFISTIGSAPIVEEGGFMQTSNATISLSGVSVFGFRATDFGAALLVDDNTRLNIENSNFKNNMTTSSGWVLGGAVMSVDNASVKIKNSLFESNVSAAQGGVILGRGAMISIDRSVFTNNSADYGSVISSSAWDANKSVSISTSRFENNTTNGGGMISLQGANGNLLIVSSLFRHNSATGDGSVIESETGMSSKVSVINSTFADNMSALSSSVVANFSSSTTYKIGFSTFIGNTSIQNMGVVASFQNPFADSYLENNLFFNNNGGECNTSYTVGLSKTGNLSQTTTCGGTSPNLVASGLAENGGFTKTFKLLLGSNAIDGAVIGTIPCPSVDQRGVVRMQDGNGDFISRCDVGAYEAPKLTLTGIHDRPSVK